MQRSGIVWQFSECVNDEQYLIEYDSMWFQVKFNKLLMRSFTISLPTQLERPSFAFWFDLKCVLHTPLRVLSFHCLISSRSLPLSLSRIYLRPSIYSELVIWSKTPCHTKQKPLTKMRKKLETILTWLGPNWWAIKVVFTSTNMNCQKWTCTSFEKLEKRLRRRTSDTHLFLFSSSSWSWCTSDSKWYFLFTYILAEKSV